MKGFNLSEWAITHRPFVWFLMILFVAAGVLSYQQLGREEDPSFSIKTMIVRTYWPGATIDDTMLQITDRIEKKLQETPSLYYLKSETLRRVVEDVDVDLSKRRAWHLPREDLRHPAPCTCPSCGGALRKIGDEVTETLDYVPGRFKVVRHIREKLSCRVCDAVVAAPAPDHAIARGRAGAGLLAHIVVSKYDDHLPLYRQAEIFARDGVSLEISTLSGWVGATAAALKPLVDALAADVLASDTLHVDDTPVPVLAPGTGKTKTGRLWTYVRDDRPFAGSRPPAALFFYSPDRKGEHPQAHLRDFRGVIHADGYAGFNELFVGGRIVEAGCWAHVRRKFFDVHAATGSPIAKQALDRIGPALRSREDHQRITARPATTA